MIHDYLALLLLIVELLSAAAGFLAGRFSVKRLFRRLVSEFSATQTLGTMLDAAQREACAQAYNDPAAALAAMDSFSYAVPNVPTPFVGSAPQPGQNDNAYVNVMQFRNTRELVMPKPADTCRIFLTGGSTAFGAGAPSQERTISGYLESLLNPDSLADRRSEVFTFANPAWASTQERIAIENRLSELQPDLVVSLSGNNDAHWALMGRNVLWFRTYSDQHFWDLLNQAVQAAGAAALPDVTEHFVAVAPDLVAERLEKNVRLGAAALSAQGAKYLFVLQPTITVSTKPLSEREERIRGSTESPAAKLFREYYAAIKARLRSLPADGVDFLDLSDAFAHLGGDDEIFLDSYHFGDRGNEVIAAALAAAVAPFVSGNRS
jgi:lysophospholipase L1-like esterase